MNQEILNDEIDFKEYYIEDRPLVVQKLLKKIGIKNYYQILFISKDDMLYEVVYGTNSDSLSSTAYLLYAKRRELNG